MQPLLPLPDAQGNFTPAPLAALQAAWTRFQAGLDDGEALLRVTRSASDVAMRELEELRGQEQRQEVGDRQLHDAVHACFIENLAALEVMEGELDEPGHGYFEDGLRRMQDAANRLMAIHHEILEAVQAAGQTVCPRCNHPNPVESSACAGCGQATE